MSERTDHLPPQDEPRPESSKPTEVLIGAIRRGDREAFDELYARYHRRVLYAVRARMGMRLRRRMQSVDIFQSAFREAYEHLDQLRDHSEGMFLHWVVRIVENKIRDGVDRWGAAKRDLDREQALDGARSGAGSLEAADRGQTPSQILAASEESERLLEYLDRLTDEEREVLILKRIESLTWPELSKQVGQSESTVRRLERRARSKIAVAMARKAPPGP